MLKKLIVLVSVVLMAGLTSNVMAANWTDLHLSGFIPILTHQAIGRLSRTV